MNNRIFAILFLVSTLSFGCGFHKKDKQIESTGTEKVDTVKKYASQKMPADCDSSLWLHVWDSPRLKVVEPCITATGIITKLKAEDDGDEHMMLKLDEGQENLLNEANIEDKKGGLVLEIVCVNEVTDKKAKHSCDGYSNNIKIPKTGDHVRVTGSYVLDTHNGWMEIHPVSKIEVIE